MIELIQAIALVIWVSGAIGFWVFIAGRQKEKMGWTHLLAALMSLYWVAIVPGIIVYRALDKWAPLPDDDT